MTRLGWAISQNNRSGDASDGMSAHPHLATGILRNQDTARAAQSGALAGDIALGHAAFGNQPLGQGRIQASRDGVFVNANRGSKGTHFKVYGL
jgi:hypothetical protein